MLNPTAPVRIYEDVPEAQRTVLRRRNLLDFGDIPRPVRDNIVRIFGDALTPDGAVSQVLADVQQRGDQALYDWTWRIDGIALTTLNIQPQALTDAYESLSPDLRSALGVAANRIRAFHSHQTPRSWSTRDLGGILGQRITPLRRVGIYVPGGTAPLPSSLLMSAIPARVAGVSEIVVCTPPRSGNDQIAPAILAAAHIAQVDRVYPLGGAQAIAAMAYGTATIPRVDKIVGAGGLFVTLAKRLVYGQVGLDGVAGPTETLIIADSTANPAWLAADLLAQAEHDVLASAILLTPSRTLAEQVLQQLTQQLGALQRAEIARTALARRGAIVLTPSLDVATQLADEYAPEHLCLAVAEPDRWAQHIHNAGGIFLGEHSFEVLGDYAAGPSHVMPTGGTARFASPLNVLDFVKITSIIGLDPGTSRDLCRTAARLAQAESLTAHAAAALTRGPQP
jgi:histidinol dehydrogenase